MLPCHHSGDRLYEYVRPRRSAPVLNGPRTGKPGKGNRHPEHGASPSGSCRSGDPSRWRIAGGSDSSAVRCDDGRVVTGASLSPDLSCRNHLYHGVHRYECVHQRTGLSGGWYDLRDDRSRLQPDSGSPVYLWPEAGRQRSGNRNRAVTAAVFSVCPYLPFREKKRAAGLLCLALSLCRCHHEPWACALYHAGDQLSGSDCLQQCADAVRRRGLRIHYDDRILSSLDPGCAGDGDYGRSFPFYQL